MPKNNYENDIGSYETLTTAYGLTAHIKQEIDILGLEEAYTSVKVDLEVEDGETDVNYTIEATDIYNELNDDPETTYFESSSRIEPLDGTSPADEEIVTETLEDELDSALKVNGEVVRELLSPDYDAF